MQIAAEVELYLKCTCGKSLSFRYSKNPLEHAANYYTLEVEPCSCSCEERNMSLYGLKTAEEIYELGFGDGSLKNLP